jgi:hypothetical protein
MYLFVIQIMVNIKNVASDKEDRITQGIINEYMSLMCLFVTHRLLVYVQKWIILVSIGRK